MAKQLSDAEFLWDVADKADNVLSFDDRIRLAAIAARLEQPSNVSAFNAGVDMAIDTLLAIIGPEGMVNRNDIENARGHAKRVGPVEQEPSEAEYIVWAMRERWLVHEPENDNMEWNYYFVGLRVQWMWDGVLPAFDRHPEVLSDIRRRMKEAANG